MEHIVKEYLAFKKGEIKMPGHLAIKKETTGSLFKNRFLEKMTRTKIYVPIILHLTISSFLYGYGITQLGVPLTNSLIALFGGFLFSTLAEYLVHRFIYHTESSSKFLTCIQHYAHGIHHQYPIDDSRLAMPPVSGLVLSAIFFLIYWILHDTYAFVFFRGL